MTIAVRAENISKKYLIAHRAQQRNDMLREELAGMARRLVRGKESPDYEDFWALDGLSFEIEQGARVGIIGRNGAGKSTLLKILSRITEPTTGRVSIRGRVASLLEVGTGFHPELTGRENVYLNGAVLGMRRDEIRRKFDEIVAFAGVEKFLDTPVKRYSSGMYVRLAFSVAAHLDPEIFIVDEVMAVGDADFQKKCMEKMEQAAEHGTTVLFVSHNIAAIQSFCRTAMLLEAGKLVEHGPVGRVALNYLDRMDQHNRRPLAGRADRTGNGAIRFAAVETCDDQGRATVAFRSGQTVRLLVYFDAVSQPMLDDVLFTVVVENNIETRVAYLSNEIAAESFRALPPSARGFEVTIERLPLLPGVYPFHLDCIVGGERADYIHAAGYIVVEGGDFFGTGRMPPIDNPGYVLIEHRFKLLDSAG